MWWGKTWQEYFGFFFHGSSDRNAVFHLDLSLFDVYMRPLYKSRLFFLYSKSHNDTVRQIYLHSLISGVDAELWHFTSTSKSGYAIQLSGISKGHNLYLFIWFLGCRCFCVEHILFEGQMSEVRVLLGSFCTTNQFAGGPRDVFSMPFLFWSHGVNVWPCSLLNRLQNYAPSRSVRRWAATQQGLSDKAMTGETPLSHVSHFPRQKSLHHLAFSARNYNRGNFLRSIVYFQHFSFLYLSGLLWLKFLKDKV